MSITTNYTSSSQSGMHSLPEQSVHPTGILPGASSVELESRPALANSVGKVLAKMQDGQGPREVHINLRHRVEGTFGNTDQSLSITITPGMSPTAIADQIIRKCRELGMNDAEIQLTCRALQENMAAEATTSTGRPGGVANMSVEVIRR